MNIQQLQKELFQFEHILPIGKTVEKSGVICHVMGFALREHTLQMLILQYDQAYRDRLEEAEIARINGEWEPDEEKEETNRWQQRGVRDFDPYLPLNGAKMVQIGQLEMSVDLSSSSPCNPQQWDHAALFSRFLLSGWNPSGVEMIDIGSMFLTDLTLEGSFDAIPQFDQNDPIHFSMRPDSIRHLVELPVTLTVGEDYPEKLYFTGQTDGQRHWAQINRVYLCDMWTEMEKTFQHPRVIESFTAEELALRKAEFEESFSEICPRGMRFPVVLYEAEKGISLQFYSSQWLDSMPHQNSSCMGFFMSPDEPVGKLGLELKAAVFTEPVPADTAVLEAELFCYHQMITESDITV